jgi:hypothetical protein
MKDDKLECEIKKAYPITEQKLDASSTDGFQ